MKLNRVEAKKYLLVLFGIKSPSEEDIQAIMKSEDPVGFAIETQLEKDYDEIYPQSPGDDVSENDMIDHGYWPPRDR